MQGLLLLLGGAAARINMHLVEGGAGVPLPEVAVCLAGAARSFATVPILRALKKNVLQTSAFSASAFAVLSYDTTSPQALDYNASLLKRLSSPQVVKRALMHLKPELKAVAYYNTSEAFSLFKPCHAADAKHTTTEVPALYAMQLCHALVREHEVGRGDERFDWILRVRPDHLFVRPLTASLRVNISSWPRDRVLAPRGVHAMSFAVVPSGPVAAFYFRTFTHASSCLFRNVPPSAERLPTSFRSELQCASKASYEGDFSACVLRANLKYHGLPPTAECARPALIARVCNLNGTSGLPSWPAWPMPHGETCVTSLDMLKRPKPIAVMRAEARQRAYAEREAAGAASDTGWHLTVAVVCVMCLGAAVAFRRRLYDDGRELLSSCEPLCPALYAQAAPLAEDSMAALDAAVDRGIQAVTELSDKVRAQAGAPGGEAR